ncbi:radical SAM protein [Zoogloea sp.]|uniref:radical SAM protein n=1 Tax=Zoogloea sp. TaxID=49181 RepID=UPI0025DFBA02|nr:radical SAM protein [Zoogloea sp.]
MSPPAPPRGRGSRLNPDNRFAEWQRDTSDDDWADGAAPEAESGKGPTTTLILDQSRSVIVRNQSPDVPFTQSINPYRGCEHGCSYCFARPGHAYLGLSPGLDFETKIVWKPDAPEILRKELAAPGYRCAPIALGISTDGWQPVERRLGLSRRLLEVLAETRHPVSIVTKSALIERDADLLADMARDHLVQVMFSITTLDPLLARRLEPRAASPARRLAAMDALHRAGVPVGVLFAPLIPALNDHELERVLEAARAAGGRKRRLRAAAPAPRIEGPLRRLASQPLPRPGNTCPEPLAPASRRPAQRQPLRPPHAWPGRVCRPLPSAHAAHL